MGPDPDGLTRLSFQGFRHLLPATLDFANRTNVIYGRNAAGKTSVLETIHFLARARSFITPRTARLINTHAESVLVHGAIASRSGTHRLGVEYGKGHTRVRLDGRDIQALSESAWLLPMQVINTEGQRLLTDGPVHRRAFINWGVFHVEHAYRDTWRRYQRALRQRNAALRAGDARLATAWEPEMAVAGSAVDEARRRFLSALMERAIAIGHAWLGATTLDWQYRPGWASGQPLESVLKAGREKELKQGFGLYGPHRADLRLLADGEEAAGRLSRGQQKLLVAALRIALVQTWIAKGHERPIVLVDDLPAELDSRHRANLLSQLQDSGAQLFITAIEPDQLPEITAAGWFHVEQGRVHRIGDV